MSVKVMGAVWDLDLPHPEAWVLMAYADHADHEGRNCYPSLELIAYKTGYSRRSVQRITDRLISRGILVELRAGGGRRQPTRYAIDLAGAPRKEEFVPGSFRGNGVKMTPFNDNGDILTPKTVSSATPEERETVSKSALNGVIAMTPEPLTINRQDEPSIEPSGSSPSAPVSAEGANEDEAENGEPCPVTWWPAVVKQMLGDMRYHQVAYAYLRSARVVLVGDVRKVLRIETENCSGGPGVAKLVKESYLIKLCKRAMGGLGASWLAVEVVDPSGRVWTS